ncbi:type VI secretion system tip protein VgrG [Burkholderia vietnamiensis]|uniref:type VI secretion system Vgr family protein n=1 Tax=Burkholderia vietnamiensis TaxID=60552 RepID=UPI0020193E5E|nr:type VI secretion system tip protein VgrG [Burkholderia vietnamiensis]MCO1351388.1 type VI secretion system tip protein VgrG [Burkholderia vietnamiensis]MCO1433408.1 type VI secretion system tip protein VgrG [Burkholderia vietnamiensis]UQN48912.1 type VI secretion system tip protein VgrG [Burkholderia vietnamiensis]
MQTIQDVLAHPSAIVTQPLHLEIATLQSPVSVFSFVLTEEMNAPFVTDITVTSKDKHIDGAAVVGRPAIFTIEEHASVPSLSELINPVQRAARTVHGIVTQWTRIKTSRDEATYQVLLKPRLALLEQVHDSAVFLDRSFRELLTDTIIDRELFQSYDVEFELDGLDAKLDQTVMYEETVANFIDRHCRRAGVFYYFKHAKKEDGPQRDTLVFSNTARGYMREIEVPLLPNSGLVSWHEAILELNVTRSLVPQTVREWDHNYRQPDDPLQVESAVAEKADRSVYGSINRSIEHFHTAEEGQALADARRDGLITRQTRIAGKSNVMGMMPGMVVRVMNDVTPEAPHGFVITKLVTTGSRKESVTNQFEAIPSHLTYRPDYVPERHWRWVAGALIGIVESGDDQPYAWMDEYGGYRVRLLFTRHTGKRGANSMSLRLLRTSASYQGGLHVPLLPNTEVRVIATQGNCDRLLIAGATHDYARRDLVHGKEGWYSRAVFRSPLLGNKLRFEDLKDHEGIRLATVFGQSSLNMGYLVDREKNKRGEGYELTTQGWGVVRAAKGLFWSADPVNRTAPHLEMQVAIKQLQAAIQRVTALANATGQARATSADKATQSNLMDVLDQLKDAGLLASAPAGMAFVTPKSIQQAAGENVIVTAGQHADVSVVKRFTVAAGELISLCAHKLGLKVFATHGKVEIQSQSDAMDLVAAKQLKLASADEDVLVVARKKIVLASGGAALKIEDGTFEFIGPGAFKIKAGSFVFQGPGNVNPPLPVLPKSNLNSPDDYPLSH